MFDNKSISITCKKNSFNQTFTQPLLERFNFKRVITFSRDKLKQLEIPQVPAAIANHASQVMDTSI